MNGEGIQFRYVAVNPSGAVVNDTLTARDRKAALQSLTRSGLVVTEITELAQRPAGQSRSTRGRTDTDAGRIAALQQLALMLRAGVELLVAVDGAASGMGGKLGDQLDKVSISLRKGASLGTAFREHVTGYPDYVYAMVELGQSTGRLHQVLADACRQMEFEASIRRDVSSALTYPAFLISAGLLAVAFLFYEVVPRFSAMLGENRSGIDGLGALVLSAGDMMRNHTLGIAVSLGAAGSLLAWLLSLRDVRQAVSRIANSLPVVGEVMTARRRTLWARMMAFSLASGLGVLEATVLSHSATKDEPLRKGLERAISSLRKGNSVETSFAGARLLDRIDISLLRAGEKSGSLKDMFAAIADNYETSLRSSLKRATALIEPIAIALVSILIGTVALGLVAAMSSLYTGIG